MKLHDSELVREEYATDAGLAGRIAAYRFAEGPDARELLFAAIAEVSARRFLEVGCGQGWLSERVQRELECEVVAVDQSEYMVELTRARGVEAVVGDVQALPFADASFDCAAAPWMLYHVADVDRALSELARVLRPGGRLVAVTNSRDHLLELVELLGERPQYSFSTENGADALGRHFPHVQHVDASGWVVFPSRSDAQAFVDSSIVWRGGRLPHFEGELRVRRTPALFVAEK